MTRCYGQHDALPDDDELRAFGVLACEELLFWLQEGWPEEEPRLLLRAAAARAYRAIAFPPRPHEQQRVWAKHGPTDPVLATEVAEALCERIDEPPPDLVEQLLQLPGGVVQNLREELEQTDAVVFSELLERAARRQYRTLDRAAWSLIHALEARNA